MPFMPWSPKLATGHPKIDEDHKRLVELVNALYEAMAAGKGDKVCGKILTDLITYTGSHFAMEEQLMAAAHYPKAAEHRNQHAALVKEVTELKKKFDAGAHTLTTPLFRFLKEWLTKHIQGSDMELAAAVAAKKSPALAR